ncbi:MAG: hypothetical protein ACI4JA_09945, partial [Oscillospiraceae bacterium]
MDKEYFKNELAKDLKSKFGKDISGASAVQLHESISAVVMRDIAERWDKSVDAHLSRRRACYLS